MSDTPTTVIVAPVAAIGDDPVYHLPDQNGHARCGCDDDRFRTVDHDSLPESARCCRPCDPDVYVAAGDGALCDRLAEMNPDEVGVSPARGD